MKSKARKPTLFELYAKPFQRRNPLETCKQQTAGRNKYAFGGGAKFKYAGGEVRVRGCDSTKVGPKKNRSAYNVVALSNLDRKGFNIEAGRDFPMSKSEIAGLRWRDKGNYKHVPESHRYALPPGKGQHGIFGVEGYSAKTAKGARGMTWRGYQGDAAALSKSEAILATRKAKGKKAKLTAAKKSPAAQAVVKAVGQDLVAQGVPVAQAKEAVKDLAIVAASSSAPTATIKEAAREIVSQMPNLQRELAGATPAQKSAIAKSFGIDLAKEVKAEVAPAEKKGRLARGKKPAASALEKVGNPFRRRY